MQDQLKERLTGAAILVVVVVLAVPEMFRGRPGVAVPADGADASAVPLHTVTVVDAPSAGPAPDPAATTTGSAAASGASGTPTASPGLAPAERPVTAGATAPASVAGAAPVAGPVAGPGAGPGGPPVGTTGPLAPETAVAAAPAAAPTTGPRPAAPAGPVAAQHERPLAHPAGTGWAVQVGSFRARELAERMARDVHAKGFKVHVVGPDPKGLYRVRSGLLADREAALALKQQMVARGLKPIVNASP